MLKALKVRIYPNVEQTHKLNRVLGCYRFIYNKMLERKTNIYKETGESCGLTELSFFFHNNMLKDDELVWLQEQNTKVMKQAIRQMLVAYTNFFEHRARFPRFKSKRDRVLSCLFPLHAISTKNDFSSGKIKLVKSLGQLKFKTSDKYVAQLEKYKNSIRSATLTKTLTNKYFLSILVETNETPQRQVVSGSVVGIDTGIKSFVTVSDGRVFENKHFGKGEEKRIKHLQKSLSRKQKGSRNRDKIRVKIAKIFERITNQKQEYLHHVVNALLDDNQVIAVEDLNVAGMVKNHHIAKSLQALSLSEFYRILKYKGLWRGALVVEIDRWYPSSKICSGCGYKYKDLTLAERRWKCPHCGQIHDRDVNAAVNICREGKRIIGLREPEFKFVDNPTVDGGISSEISKKPWLDETKNDDLSYFTENGREL
jgi:putative transposase